jgi:hypothetical protein
MLHRRQQASQCWNLLIKIGQSNRDFLRALAKEELYDQQDLLNLDRNRRDRLLSKISHPHLRNQVG